MDSKEKSSKDYKGEDNIKLNNKRVSAILKNLLKEFSGKPITIGDLANVLADRAFAILLFIFALPNLVPFPIPGLSAILGVPLIVLSFQLMTGRKSPLFPKWISKHSFNYKDMRKVVYFTIPYLKKAERFLKPRFKFLLKYSFERIIAFICFIMAIMITLPIPLGNWLPAMTICLFAIAMLEHDGIFVLLGMCVATVSIILVSIVLITALKSFLFFL